MNILLLDDRVPDPEFGAGFPRAYRLLLSLIQLGHRIYFLPTVRKSITELDHNLLATYGITVYDDINKIPSDVDVVIMSRPHNVHYYLQPMRSRFPNAKLIYDTEALWYRRYDLQMSITGRLPGWAYRYDEIGLAKQVDLCFTVNEIEKAILHENGVEKVVKLGHALYIHEIGKSFGQRSDFLVVGGKLEPDSSNEDALWSYLQNAWGAVREKTKANMFVTGEVTSPRLESHGFKGVELMGHVSNLIPLYENKRIFVAATRFATGIPWKCHEAMAHGIPCVISKLLSDQLELTPDRDAMVANSPQEFVEKSIWLYHDRKTWEAMRYNAFKLVVRDCSPQKFQDTISATLNALVQ